MRNFSTLLIICLFTISCGHYGHKEVNKQVDNESYLSFKGNLENVSVIIDDGEPFLPLIDPKSFSKDIVYSIKPGNHEIKIFRLDELILHEKFYIGNQETKELNLK